MTKAYKRPESVLVVVYTRAGKALMLRRADHPEFWQSITGSLEWSEADLRAVACRELQEETGIDAGAALHDWGISNRYVIFPEWRHRYAPGITENTEHVFSLELDAEVPVRLNPKEHSAYEWLDLDAAAQRATSWTNRDVLRALAQQVRGCPQPANDH